MAAYVYLETAPGSRKMNYRGEVGPNDNPDSFADLMGRSGLRVQVLGDFKGTSFALPEPEPVEEEEAN